MGKKVDVVKDGKDDDNEEETPTKNVNEGGMCRRIERCILRRRKYLYTHTRFLIVEKSRFLFYISHKNRGE